MPNGPVTYAPPLALPDLMPPDVDVPFPAPEALNSAPTLPETALELPLEAPSPPPLVPVDVVTGGDGPGLPVVVPPARPDIQLATVPVPDVGTPPDITPLDQALAEPRQRVADVQAVRTGVAEQMQELNQQRIELAQELQDPALPPERRAEIVRTLGELGAQEEQLGMTEQAARRAGQVELAGMAAASRDAQESAARDLQQSYLVEADARAEQARAQLEERRAQREQARAVAAERRHELQAKLQEEAPTGAAQAALGMIGELLTARAQRRPPNFAVAMEYANQARQLHSDEIERLRASAALADDDVDAQLALDARIAAEERAAEAAALAELDRELARISLQSQGLPQGVAAQMARDQVQSQLAAADAQAVAAQEDAALKRREAEAKIAKLQAETAKIEGETKVSIGVGPRRADDDAPQALAANVVTERGTQDVVVEYPDTSEGRKRAKEARTALANFTRRYETLRQAVDRVEQLDGKQLEDFLALSRREQYTRLGVSSGILQSQLAKQLAGGFSPSETDMAKAAKMLPTLDFTNAEVVKDTLSELADITLEEWRHDSNRLGIPTEASERAVAASTRRTVSQADRRRNQLRRAEDTLRNAEAAPAERIAAVRLMEERTRLDIERRQARAKQPMEGDEFVRLSAMRRLQNIRDQAEREVDDPDVIAAIEAELQRLRAIGRKEQAAAIERTEAQAERAEELREQAERQNVQPRFGGGRAF